MVLSRADSDLVSLDRIDLCVPVWSPGQKPAVTSSDGCSVIATTALNAGADSLGECK